MNKYNINIILAVAFLVSANVRADMIIGGTWFSDRDTYMDTVAAPNWTFGTFKQEGDTKSPLIWNFTIINEDVQLMGKLTMSNFNGGGGLMEVPQGGSGTMTFWHNSANNYAISFGNADFVNSFYMGVAPHSSWSAAIHFAATATYMYNGKEYTTDTFGIDQNNAFFGIALEEGAYLTAINFWSTGTPNNGYKITAGFGGNENVANPEPATLAVLGLGLIGLALVRKRMKK